VSATFTVAVLSLVDYPCAADTPIPVASAYKASAGRYFDFITSEIGRWANVAKASAAQVD
jgi:hypothetical protein